MLTISTIRLSESLDTIFEKCFTDKSASLLCSSSILMIGIIETHLWGFIFRNNVAPQPANLLKIDPVSQCFSKILVFIYSTLSLGFKHTLLPPCQLIVH